MAANDRSTLADFKLMGKLGSGTYGVVWKVVRKCDNTTYALKEVPLAGLSRKEQEACVNEVQVLAKMDSPYIVKYFDCFIENKTSKLYIVTEYASGGTLYEYINKQGKKGLPEAVVWRLLIQLTIALYHMHQQKVLHRDIKSLNVFLGQNGTVKLGDLGVAKVLSTQTNFAKTVVGTPYYLSPELCSGKPYDDRSDIWALGIVLYECCTGSHPFDAESQGALVTRILRGKYTPVPGTYGDQLREIVKRCLLLSSKSRPTCQQLLAMPAVQQMAADLKIAMPTGVPTAAPAKRPSSGKGSKAAVAPAGQKGEGVIKVTGAEGSETVTEQLDNMGLDDAEKKETLENVEKLKSEAKEAVGAGKFDELYKYMKGHWKDEEQNSNGAELTEGIFKIIPEDKADVVALMYKILFQEEAAGL